MPIASGASCWAGASTTPATRLLLGLGLTGPLASNPPLGAVTHAMSKTPPTRPGVADLDLLLGVLALQLEFIRRDQLEAALRTCALDLCGPLGAILVGQGHLTPDRLALLNVLLKEHLYAHHGDPLQSL